MDYQIVPDKDGRATKCWFDDERALKMCWPLEEAVEFPYGRGSRRQGLKFLTLTNMKTHKFARNAIGLISGEHQKNGVEITFCPFCASVLNPYLAEEISVSVSERQPASLPEEPR